METLIEVRDLVKDYRETRAVDGIHFTISRGRCCGLLGPNGAGKTTTIEMLEGITPATAGVILYKGEPLGTRFRNEAGIMFQATALQDFITVYEALRLFQRLYPRGADLDGIIESCALEDLLDRDTRRLSGGQRQRLLLAIALVNDPEIVFLDEPTTGLDPQARRNFWALVENIKARGKTILLTTHYMEEAYRLCDDIVIMDRGRIIAQGTPDELLAAHFSDVVLQLPAEDFGHPQEGLSETVLAGNASVEILTHDVNQTLNALMQRQIPLNRLQIRQRTLEDLFLEITGKELRP